jgi:hypothetical protein
VPPPDLSRVLIGERELGRMKREAMLHRVAVAVAIVVPMAALTVGFVLWPRLTIIWSVTTSAGVAFMWALHRLSRERPID